MPKNDEGRPVAESARIEEEMHEDASRSQHTSTAVDGPDAALSRFLTSIGSTPQRGRALARDGFTVWLIAQRHRDDWVGHLAQEVAQDTTWPRGQVRLRELHDYLHDLGAEPDRHAALDQAWAEWREAAI